jgi:hypothetical protein
MISPVEQELRKIIAVHGYSICREHRRVEAILRDLCAPYRLEVSVLVAALNEGIGSDLLEWQDAFATEIMLPRFTKRLQNNRGLTEAASRWAVETWAKILIEPSRPIGNRWYEFTGCGHNTSAPFDLDSGLVIFEATQEGRGNFFVELFDSTNRYIRLLFNDIGRSRSKRPIGISLYGSYYLETRADGDWKIQVRQSRAVSVESTPVALIGSGQYASPFINLESLTGQIEANHIGSDNFTVTLLSSTGQFMNLLINEIGNCSLQTSFQVKEPGIYLLDVSARGDWTITLT